MVETDSDNIWNLFPNDQLSEMIDEQINNYCDTKITEDYELLNAEELRD